jgi:hypothetical protein
MKKYLIFITYSLLCFGCERDLFDKDDPTILEKDSFSEGVYLGNFVLHDQAYWCVIEFNGNKYEEWPISGGNYQKEMSCLTTGSFSINNSILKYDLDKYKFSSFAVPCNSEMILPGDYKIHLITLNDSLVFSKGIGKDKIKYHLIKVLK